MTARDVVAEVKDTLIGWLIGSGYYAMTVGVDEAREMTNALAAAGLLATPEHDAQVAARALREAADAVHDRFEGGGLNSCECDDVRRWLRARARAAQEEDR